MRDAAGSRLCGAAADIRYDRAMRRLAVLIVLSVLMVGQVSAQQEPRPGTSNYRIPTDVQPVGGGEEAESSNYLLDDTIGEGNIGPSGSATYTLNAGYRQTLDTFLGMTCDATVGLGTITRTGDTSVEGCGVTGYCASRKAACTVITDHEAGYTLSWLVQTGTGAAGARTGTGHLNGFRVGNRIQAFGTGSVTALGQPRVFTVSNDARWAGRLSSTSTTVGGAGKFWGSDGLSDTWLRVATGSSVSVAARTNRTSESGDVQNIGLRAIIQGTAIVPNDVYRATVVFTAVTN